MKVKVIQDREKRNTLTLYNHTEHFLLVQACLRTPPVVVDKVKLAIVLVQACLRAPHVVADEAKLAIVFTYFLFPPPSLFHPLRGNSRE